MSSEIEKAAREIEQACESFQKIYRDLIEQGEKFEIKLKDRLEKIGKDLKDYYKKSEGIEEAWHLNKRQFKEGRIEKDAFERRLTKLTEDITGLKFDFQIRVRIELETFERHFNTLLQQRGIPSILPPVGQEIEVHIKEQEKDKVEAVARSIDETRKKLGEVGVKEAFGDPEAYNTLGIFYAESKKWKEAKRYFENALEINPNNGSVWNNLAVTYCNLGKRKQAIESMKKALEINPDDALAWYNLGVYYSDVGDLKQEKKCYEKALEINPNDDLSWYNLGVSYYKSGDHKQAIRYYKKTLKTNPEYAMAWSAMGVSHSKLGDHKQAIKYLKRALEISPEYAKAWLALGLAYRELGNKAEAKQCFKKAAKLGSRAARALAFLT